MTTTAAKTTTHTYEPWRHGGWYVTDVQYPSGAAGCVSRNYPDKKWRIVCDPRRGTDPQDYTYLNRNAAADAEAELARVACVAAYNDETMRAALETAIEAHTEDRGQACPDCDDLTTCADCVEEMAWTARFRDLLDTIKGA